MRRHAFCINLGDSFERSGTYVYIVLILVTLFLIALTLFSHCRGCTEVPGIPRSLSGDLQAPGEIEGGREEKGMEGRRKRGGGRREREKEREGGKESGERRERERGGGDTW